MKKKESHTFVIILSKRVEGRTGREKAAIRMESVLKYVVVLYRTKEAE